MECDRKKSDVFNWHEKKNMHKKEIAQPSPQKFNGPSLTQVHYAASGQSIAFSGQ